jgi:hypothetical protein
MQFVRNLEVDASQVAWGVRVLLVSASDATGVGARLAGLGAAVEHEADLYAGLQAAMEDPGYFGLLVVDCDGFGGVAEGQKAFRMLGDLRHRLPVILISSDLPAQDFPQDRNDPVCLRAPLSGVAMRLGFEHALRERLAWKAA